MSLDLPSREPLKLIADIILQGLALSKGQVMVSNQKYNIPTSPGIYVTVSYVSGKPIGNNNYGAVKSAGMNEIQELAMSEVIQIDVMSQDSSARTRKEEIIMALRSDYAKELCEKNRMFVARMPSAFMNTSSIESTSMLTRYTMTIIVNALYKKTIDQKYFDDIHAPVIKNN